MAKRKLALNITLIALGIGVIVALGVLTGTGPVVIPTVEAAPNVCPGEHIEGPGPITFNGNPIT